jgi:hypothetical protein
MALAMKNMLMDQLTLYLTQEMTTNVTDDTQAEVTREGKLQQDPTSGTGINILIMTEDEVDPDELWTLENAEGLRAPAYEIGGGPTFYYRFRLKYTMHFRGLQGSDGRSEARARAYTVLGRSKKAVLMMPLPINPTTNSPRDDFNESVFDVQIDEHELRTSGGNNHYIWKGWMNFGYLVNNDTERFTGVLL